MSKVYFVSGGSRGIGFGIVKNLSATPSNIVIATARNPDSATGLKELAKVRPNVKIVALDVADDESVKAAAKDAERISPLGIDVLISNAGIATEAKPVLECSDSAYMHHFNVNTIGPIRLLREFRDLLEKKSTKQIVMVSSEAGSITNLLTFFPTSAYGMSKVSLNFAVRLLDHELGPAGYSIIALHPGVVLTDAMTSAQKDMDPETVAFLAKNMTLLSPDESASCIVNNVLDKLDTSASGKFLSYDGSELAW
ncbi:SDR family oxidoreductase LALA0_S01e00254g [Lachancea lanzarotensis]|uniref:LALA0S01e00254g1_1 n=1 Tax=Lachancea lanzarotensis TaxID=1245769 RepID=A0A0C7MJQ3_9SACH|nr:uncharacterized protein LALA0_S01e00254g [Lachancea lanzarotensis]CEP59978.1 LALA0S01e00254g1_1 [Lachancea lanzarotensis]